MIISFTNKSIYVGIPHTGSSSIHTYARDFECDSLIVNGWVKKHQTLSQVADILKDEHSIIINEDWTCVYFVRNPLNFFMSEFFLMERMCGALYDESENDYDVDSLQIDSWKQKVVEFCNGNHTLDSYILARIDKITDFNKVIDHFVGANQGSWSLKKVKKIPLPYEDFEESFKITCQILGIPAGKCPMMNYKSEEQEKQKLTADTIKILENAGVKTCK